MTNNSSNFIDWADISFKPITRDIWLEAIAKELKGKDPQMLVHSPETNITIHPFEMDVPQNVPIQPHFTSQPRITEVFQLHSKSIAQTNAAILKSLEGGAEALYFFSIDSPDESSIIRNSVIFSPQSFSEVLKGVIPQYIHIYFGSGLSHLGQDFGTKHPDAGYSVLHGTEAIKDMHAFDNHHVFVVQSNETVLTNQLADMLTTANRMVEQLCANGVSPIAALSAISLQFTGAKHGFLETICALRAFHLLWFQFSKAWSGTAINPSIQFKTVVDTEPDNPHKRLIDLTLEFTAAYLGGVSFITSDLPGFESEDVGRRMLRNIHHLLRYESGFSQFSDLVCGSYSLEHLTTQLATGAWLKFQQG